MTEEQIFLVFNKNGCVAAPCGVNATEWYLSETDSSWNDKIGVVLPGIKKVIFGIYSSANILTFKTFSIPSPLAIP